MDAPLSNVHEVGQIRETLGSHVQHTRRFDTAEQLYAAKEVQPTQSPNDRPRSLAYEHNTRSEPKKQAFPPTRLGALLNPSFAEDQEAVQDKGMREDAIASKALAAEDSAALVDEERGATAEEDDMVFPKDLGCAPGADNTKEASAPVCNERRISPLASDAAPCSTSKQSIAAREMKASPATSRWASSFATTITVLLAAVFCVGGIYRAVTIVHDSREYHLALKTRIDKFEASITESHEKVLKLEEDYVIWSEYVRKLTEEDEQHALTQLEAIQAEVQKWQQEMKADLAAFRQALAVDSIEASFAPFDVNNTEETEQ